MIKRGRKSAAALAVVTPIPGQRPAPPKILTADEKAVWKATVATKPAEWFQPDSWPMLTAYCRAVVMVDRLSVQIEAFGPLAAIGPLNDLLKMRDRETRSMTALARAMRLTHQSRLKAETANTAHERANGTSGMKKPWQQ